MKTIYLKRAPNTTKEIAKKITAEEAENVLACLWQAGKDVQEGKNHPF